MKTISIFKIRGFLVAATLGMSFGFMAPASADVIADLNSKVVSILATLGTNPNIENNSFAFEINDAGQVAGYSFTSGLETHAIVTGPDGTGVTDLGTLGSFPSEGWGINNSGQVVGRSYLATGGYHAFIADPNRGDMTDLGTLGGSDSIAYGINDSGRVVGDSFTAEGDDHAFITGPGGVGMTDLGTLAGGGSVAGGGSGANAINNAGQVVGLSTAADNNVHAYITGPNGEGMTDLGTLGGSHSQAYGINETGQVVGTSITAEGENHAFITGPAGVGMTDLGTLGGSYSVALGINEAGQVVGYSITAEGENHAFITGPDGLGMTDLNSLVDLPAGMVLTEARDINNAGQAISYAMVIPEPESYALLLAGLALIGVVARGKKDIARLQAETAIACQITA